MRRFGATVATIVALVVAFAAQNAASLDPLTFSQDSTGIVLVEARCPGGTDAGTGFLVSADLVMTARHVIKGCSDIRVHTQVAPG